MTRALRLLPDERGSAATEMALVLPILLALMFGAFELGNYFLSEHVVQKAVRDAARYGARLPLVQPDGTVNYTCTGPTLGTAAQTEIQKVARTGDPAGTAGRLRDWTDDAMTTVTLTCDASVSHTYVNHGVYSGYPNSGAVPILTVSATVPYSTFFGPLGLGSGTVNLNAKSQAAVIGA
jgi:Flp pilus assembly protein TadG